MDESISNSILAGVLVLLTAAWTLWGACWLRRVELRRDKEPLVRALGLDWSREGLGPSVRATGTLGGERVEVWWHRGLLRDRVRVRHGAGPKRGGWQTLASDDAVQTWLAELQA